MATQLWLLAQDGAGQKSAWESFLDFCGSFMNVLAFLSFLLAFGVLFVAPIFHQGLRSYRLLETFYRGQRDPAASARKTFTGLLRRCLPGIRNWERMTLLFDATRIVVEYELLNPFDEAVENSIFSTSASNQNRKHLSNLRAWQRDVWGRLQAFLDLHDRRLELSDLEPLSVANCFALSEREDESKRYFQALQSDLHVVNSRSRFLSAISFESGYVAPLHLIYGSLNRFNEDWSLIHNYYAQESREGKKAWSAMRDKVKLEEAWLDQFRALQMHEFDCWLQWGPSISICTCEQWRAKDNQLYGSVALQFGFGDENNSIPLLPAIKDSEGELTHYGKLLKAVMACQPAVKAADKDESDKTSAQSCACLKSDAGKLAIQTRITARPVWAVSAKESDPDWLDVTGHLCKAQEAIFTEKGPETVLDYISHEPVNADTESNYYSAYLWVMFVVCIRDGEKFTPFFNDDHKWRGMLPFFEHANIANAYTCNNLRQVLAEKALSTLKNLWIDLRKTDNEVANKICFACVCSVDDTGCDKSSRVNGNIRSHAGTVMDLIECRLGQCGVTEPINDPSSSTEQISPSNYIVIPRGLNAIREWEAFSSCHLPELVESYLVNMDKAAKANE